MSAAALDPRTQPDMHAVVLPRGTYNLPALSGVPALPALPDPTSAAFSGSYGVPAPYAQPLTASVRQHAQGYVVWSRLEQPFTVDDDEVWWKHWDGGSVLAGLRADIEAEHATLREERLADLWQRLLAVALVVLLSVAALVALFILVTSLSAQVVW